MNSHLRLLLFISLLLSYQYTIANEPTLYTFAVVPQQSAKKLAKLWGPVLEEVGKNAGITLQFRTAKDIPTFEKRLANSEYDFAYMNPYHYVIFNKQAGYQAFAKRKNQKIRGILVTKKADGIKSISELNQKNLAFPSPAAFAATLLTQGELKQENITFTAKYVSSHDSVYLTVAKGLFPAGGGVMRTFNSIDPKIRDQLDILLTTQPYTPHAFATHANIKESIKERVENAFISLSTTEKGQTLLASLQIHNGIEKAQDSDWNDVRAITSEHVQANN